MPLHRTTFQAFTLKTAKRIAVTCVAVAIMGQLASAEEKSTRLLHKNQPSQNFYGLPGLIDMPSAEALPDGQFAVTLSYFAGISRNTITFQATPRLTASFRYAGTKDFNIGGFVDYRDRSFDIRYLAVREKRYMPALAVGLQDFAGTGIYSGEYVVATKTFNNPLSLPGTIKVTAGVGWGRLADGGVFDPARPRFTGGTSGANGGTPSYDTWFRGKASPFAGIEWQVNDRLGLKLEYSSDTYDREVRQGVLERKSNVNFGAEYQYSERVRLGAYYLYGSEFGINAQIQLNPRRALNPLRVSAPRAVVVRPTRKANPEAWRTDWAQSASAPTQLRDLLMPELQNQGLKLYALSVTASSAELRFINQRYQSDSIAVGRAARSLARILPPSVETFKLVIVQNDLPVSLVTIRRSDLEALEFQPDAADALFAVTGFGDATPQLVGEVRPEDATPKFSYSIGPYVDPSYFDPDKPVRADAGIRAAASYKFAPGWKLAGSIKHRLIGNIGDSTRTSNSVLPRVRTNGLLYSQGSTTRLSELYLSKQWKPGNSTYARVTAGYLEQMFAGVSGELLWKPSASRLALGVEANYVKQRDFDGAFGLLDYTVATGHVSAYYEFGNGYHGQLDVGRYLAGDIGGTVTLTREFRNGWAVGGFFTLTDVSSADFGEGSFDKGINLTIPVNWFLGKPTQRTISTTIRPIQRDGGARLIVPGRLYEQVRGAQKKALSSDWARVWE